MPNCDLKPSLTKQLNCKSVRRRTQNAEAVCINQAIVPSGRNDFLPECKVELRPVGELKPAKRRTRKLTNEQLERVIQSIRRNGFVGAILIREGRVVDGHVRLEAARRLGLSKIPCIPIEHLNEDETRVLALSMSRIAETGEWDLDELKVEMTELIALELDLSVTGFSAQEQDIILLDPAATDGDEEAVPDPPAMAVARLGDTFILDKHRIHCGDATKEESYARVLAEQIATACLTDPPFNVKIENNVSGLGKHKHGEFVMASGEMTVPEFEKFLEAFLKHCTATLIDRGTLFAFMDWRSIHLLIKAGLGVGLELINLAVWDKGSGGMGAFYRSTHELIPIFCKGASPAVNNIQLGRHGRDRCNIFRYPGANKPGSSAAGALAVHATPKNVDLIADAILDVTRRGDVVLDPFLGSGTTIIAAEKTGRIACGLELDPKFVDVCIRRWEQLTGGAAVHEQSGMTFAELTEERLEASPAEEVEE